MSKEPRLSIRNALIRILRPLVKLLIKNEISHGEFSEVAKECYVQVARESFQIPPKKMTHSRVAVLTGLSRKEVLRVTKSESAGQSVTKVKPNRAARVITGWLADTDFTDKDGSPKCLDLHGVHPSFNSLCKKYSGDITSGAILTELVNLKIVSLRDGQSVVLNEYGYIPDAGEIEGIDVLSICAADLLKSAVHNLDKEPDESARFQRQLAERDVPKKLAEEFAKECQSRSLELLLDMDKWLSKRIESADKTEDETISRLGLGIYYYEDED